MHQPVRPHKKKFCTFFMILSVRIIEKNIRRLKSSCRISIMEGILCQIMVERESDDIK